MRAAPRACRSGCRPGGASDLARQAPAASPRLAWNSTVGLRKGGLRRRGAGGAEGTQNVFERRGDQLVCCLAGRLPGQPASRRGAVQPGPALKCVAQPRRVLGDLGVTSRDQSDGAAHEVDDHAADVRVGDVLAASEGGEPDRAVRLGPVEPARHVIRDARTGAAAHRRPNFVFTVGADPLDQRDVDLLAPAEVVVHEPAGDAGGTRDVLDRDLVVRALGEQRVRGVQDLLAPLFGSEAAELRRGAHKWALSVVGDPSRAC